MKHNRSALWLVLFFIISILIRLPHLNRPLSKHHEFNTAVILLGLESWKQGGGAKNFNFIPLLNYQSPADKLLEKAPYSDEEGNYIYLSFGPGWYVIPYVVFNTFNISFTPLALQILNLFFLLISVFLLYRFIYYLCIKAGYEPSLPSLGGCFVFLFNPSILWFLGNGYVCTGIVLPFLITILHYGCRMLYEPGQIKSKSLLVFLLAGIGSIYIDWYGVSFLAIISIASLLKIQQNNKYWSLFWISSLATVLGILIILVQFISYAGWEKVYDYWTLRYINRGPINPNINMGQNILRIVQNLITGFLPVMIPLIIGFIIVKRKFVENTVAQPMRMAIFMSLIACLAHWVIFLNWTSAHDFAVIPFSIFLALLSGWIITRMIHTKYVLWMAIFMFLATISQYYYINYPGQHTSKGLPYRSYKDTGELIHKLAKENERIFCNDSYMIYQFYAKRSFKIFGTYEDALQWARKYQVQKWVWIKICETPTRIFIEEVKHFE